LILIIGTILGTKAGTRPRIAAALDGAKIQRMKKKAATKARGQV
jgi:hypothetical protein